MTPLATISTALFSWGTLFIQVIILVGAIVLTMVIFRHPSEALHRLSRKAADHAFLWGFIVSFVSLVSSLFYSNIVNFPPCELCWWQRVFLYPQAFLFAIALYNEKVRKVQDDMVFLYSLVLSIIGGGIAIFHYYGQMFAPGLLAACLADGVSCSQLFFVSFGYITIPMMSLTAYAFLVFLYFFRKHHRKA
ncbi:MAG: disulfide bond formation protein B [Candidatus Paceibacterota bacterium]|jgi:disulfide bond formation protein DsbB